MASQIKLTDNTLSPVSTWDVALSDLASVRYLEKPECVSCFDQHAYHMTTAEQMYAKENGYVPRSRRLEYLIYDSWMTWDKNTGAHFNHCDLFQRRGFSGDAKRQLDSIAPANHMLHKLINMKPKWGIDVSIDYVDQYGKTYEVFHFEWDGFSYEEVVAQKKNIEAFIMSKDWDREAEVLWGLREQWGHLDLMEQSDWKCDYYQLPRERYKNVIWDV